MHKYLYLVSNLIVQSYEENVETVVWKKGVLTKRALCVTKW